MRFEVLGPLRVTTEDGDAPIEVPAARQRVLLAVLLARANEPVPVDELVDLAWEGSPPPGAPGTVRAYIARLRRVLGERAGARIATHDPGYAIEVAEAESDVLRAERLCRDAGEAARTGEWEHASAYAAAALALWRGTPLVDVPCQALRDRWLPHLEELRLRLLEYRIEADLRSARHEHVVAELRDLASRHPLRERFHEQLVVALARGGRQAEALAAYREARRALVEELGIEPGPELRRLQERILAGDPELTACAAGGSPGPAAPRTPVPHQLPAAIPHFAGREDELKLLSELLERSAEAGGTVVISTIDGTAGVGKTALAVCWAHRNADRFPDGQLYVNLRGFDPSGAPVEPASAARGFLEALGVPEADVPAGLEARLALYRSLLSDRRALVVLDNARDVEQVRPLLAGTGGSLVLVTSRNQLGGLVAVDGAVPVTLDLLTEADARDLLTRRLGAERVVRESDAVDELIGLCARLPLALNLAAARAALRPSHTLADTAEELRDTRRRLEILTLGEDAADVRAVFSWSYRALDAPAARMFRLLGLHPGSDVGVAAAASLAAVDPDRAGRLLDDLTAAHLLTEHGPGRYTFHDLLRVYAVEQSHTHDGAAERSAALRRARDFYVHTAHTAALVLNPRRPRLRLEAAAPGTHVHPLPDMSSAMAWLDVEHPNLLAVQRALGDRDHLTVWQLARTLTAFHHRRGYLHDEVAMWQAALAAAEHLPDPSTRVEARQFLGLAYAGLGHHQEGIGHLRQALALTDDDPDSQATTHFMLARAWERQGEQRLALRHATRAWELHHALDYAVGQAHALSMMGWCAAHLDDYESARAHCLSALALHRRHQDLDGEANTLDSLGYIAHRTGHHRQAVEYYREALARFRRLDSDFESATSLDGLGRSHAALGKHREARAVWRQALELYRRQGRTQDADRVRRRLDALG